MALPVYGGALFNTILFTGSLLLLFWHTDFIQGLAAGQNILAFVVGFVGLNGLVEALVCFVVSSAVSKALVHFIPANPVLKEKKPE